MRRRAASRARGLLGAILVVLVSTAGWAAADDARATAAAERLLARSVEVDRQGQYNLLLRALRHLRDPALEPLYESLTLRAEPALQVHGLLGLAELSPDGRVDVARVATIEDPLVQAELITAALDAEMIAPADFDTMLAWEDLNDGVRLLLYARQLENGEAVSADAVAAMLNGPRLGRRGLAALLLTELGDERGPETLIAIDGSSARNRDAVRGMLLETAMRHDLGRARQWAYAVATEPEGGASLSLLGLRAALRLGEPRAVELWSRRFASAADDPAGRVRLSLVLVQMAPHLPGSAFDAMRNDDDPLVRQLGRAGHAIAEGEPTTVDELVALVELGHPIANQWAVGFAQEGHIDDTTAALTLMAVIQSFEADADARRLSRWLDQSVEATRALVDVAPGSAAGLLRPVLEHPATSAPLEQAILLGLVRSQRPEALAVIDGLDAPNDAVARGLWLLLRSRGEGDLTPTELDDLATLVAGGADLDPSLRAQAAWTYLQRTAATDGTLDRLTDSP